MRTETGLHMFATCPGCGAVDVAMCHVDRTDKEQLKRIAAVARRGYAIAYVGNDRFEEFRDQMRQCTCGKPATPEPAPCLPGMEV